MLLYLGTKFGEKKTRQAEAALCQVQENTAVANRIAFNLNREIVECGTQVEEVTSHAQSVKTSAEQMEQVVDESSRAIQTVSEKLNTAKEQIDKNYDYAQQLEQSFAEVTQAVNDGNKEAKTVQKSMLEMSETVGQASDATAGLLEQMNTITGILNDINAIAGMIFDYTSGYPFLVSKLCKLIDEIVAEEPQFLNNSWTKEGLLKAVNILLKEKNTLFESLVNKLADYPELRKVIYALLFNGKMIPYNPLNPAIEMAEMFGFIKRENDTAVISNRIFETVLYNYFLSEEFLNSKMYDAALQDKNQFVKNGQL